SFGQSLLTLKQRGSIMKVSQAIDLFREYHHNNSKKKYGPELYVHLDQIQWGVRRQRPRRNRLRRNPFLFNPKYLPHQTEHQKKSLCMPEVPLQIYYRIRGFKNRPLLGNAPEAHKSGSVMVWSILWIIFFSMRCKKEPLFRLWAKRTHLHRMKKEGDVVVSLNPHPLL
ncbi:hypothetical protein LCGC14_2880640, partial [marine sediment metagenome]